jgi:hypothetical protein
MFICSDAGEVQSDCAFCVQSRFILDDQIWLDWGTPHREVTPMERSVVAVLIGVAFVVLTALAIMNNACKSSQHAWCTPVSTVRHQFKIGNG